MCFVHAFLPSDFFVHLSGCCLPSSGYGRYQRQMEVSYTSCPGAPALLEFLPLRLLRWPRFLPRLRLPGSLLCRPAAAGFPWQFRSASVLWAFAAHTCSPSPRDKGEPEVARAAASRCCSRSSAVRVTAERRWLRPPRPLRVPGGSGRRASYSRTSIRRYLDAESCGPATGDLRIAQDDRKLSDPFEECASFTHISSGFSRTRVFPAGLVV